MKRRLVYGMVWVASLALAADPALSEPAMTGELKEVSLQHCGLLTQPTLAPGKTLRAAFEQERFIAALTKPLLSSGVITVSADSELLWETRRPIPSTVRINDAGFALRTASAETIEYSERKFQQLASLLLSLHTLSSERLESLKEHFALSCASDTLSQFRLRAVPNTSALAEVLREVNIWGKDKPTRIEVIDGRGERTVVRLVYDASIEAATERPASGLKP